MSALEEMEAAVRGAADRAWNSVVGVGQRWGVGSGVVLKEGKVLTNAHNLRGDPIAVTFADGRTEEGRLAGVDPDGDLAVLDVETGGAAPIEWSEHPPGLGSAVVALANPGGRGVRASLGFVSGTEQAFRGPRGRRISGGVEHTAPLPRGSSGGPVVDPQGRLLGINTNRSGDGLYVAIPADTALRERVESLGRGESVRRPRLGVAVAPPHVARRMRAAVGLPERPGLLVHGIEEGSPADAAGLRRGDLIVAAAGTTVTDADSLHEVLDAAGPSSSVTLTIVRGSDERSVSVALEAERSERGEA